MKSYNLGSRLPQIKTSSRSRTVLARSQASVLDTVEGYVPDIDTSNIGIRYDQANNRWLRDSRSAGNLEEYLDNPPVYQPKQGQPYVLWPLMWGYLVKQKLKSITPEVAYKLQQENGAYIVDVRVAEQFEKQSIEGSLSVPLFRYVQGSSVWDNLKKAVMMVGFAMKATERNPDFEKVTAEKLPDKNAIIIVVCGLGGTLKTTVSAPHKSPIMDPDRAFGREARSLRAAYFLFRAGYTNVAHLQGGISQWRYDGYPVV